MNAYPLLAAGAALALSGCGGRGPVSDNLNESGNVAAIVNSADAVAAAASHNAPTPVSPGSAPAPAKDIDAPALGGIPRALLGRWGMTPVDCTSTRGDAKGLLVIEPDGLHFYESHAVPGGRVQTSANSMSGEFHFTGEGQQWTRYETLQIQNGNLVRTETDPMASYTYARCE